MNAYNSADIRNIALLGHAGSGKTTLTETILAATGAINQPGSIARKSTVTDFDPQEHSLQHSLEPGFCSTDYHGKHINLIDTPGYPDFVPRALAVLPAVETCAVVLNAQSGIEPVAQRAMEAAAEQGLCRIVIVNRIDEAQADLENLVREIREAFGDECLPINLPAKQGSTVVDCFFKANAATTDFSSAQQAHTQIIDQVVEVDEVLMEKYLEQGEDLSPEQLHEPFEKALREGHLIPVCFVSANSGAGVPELLDIFEHLMPNPMEGNPPYFFTTEEGSNKQVSISPSAEAHVVAHVFKVRADQFVGKLGVFRIHQGTVTPNSQLFIGDARKPFKVSHLLRLQGKDTRDMTCGIPGDICGVAKVDDITVDAVLHDSHDEDDIHLQSVNSHPPMFGLAVQSVRQGDEQKLSDALHKLESEDPCLNVEHNARANETVIRGTGELHLRLTLEKMRDKYNVEVNTHPPSIAYVETIAKSAEGHHRHKKQTGGAGQFGEVFLKVEPLHRGGGFEFVDKIVGAAIPNQFVPAVEKGVRQVLEQGAIAGYPLQDVRVTVYDGKHHPVDSKEIAFVTAGKKAFMEAVSNAKPQVLEPIVNIEIRAPNDALGDITGDLSSKRGRINGTEALVNNRIQIKGQVPQSEVLQYQSELKSMTAGEGTYTIEFSHHDPVPTKLQQELIAAFSRDAGDE